MNKNQALHILMVGMTLGTAWAVRGHFGHEQGAAGVKTGTAKCCRQCLQHLSDGVLPE